ncbi:hypothetical protein J6590_048403 [Homalodisca vitripennis]|nr:hypothetical protein J6590_048403 [Homalodisca vitripennis]
MIGRIQLWRPPDKIFSRVPSCSDSAPPVYTVPSNRSLEARAPKTHNSPIILFFHSRPFDIKSAIVRCESTICNSINDDDIFDVGRPRVKK